MLYKTIPVNGVIINGSAIVNQVNITGEGMSVHKITGDVVYSNTIVEYVVLKVQPERVACDTTFSKILELVAEGQAKKRPKESFIKNYAKYYTPSIFILSIIVYIFTIDLKLSLTLLVISFPGSLLI